MWHGFLFFQTVGVDMQIYIDQSEVRKLSRHRDIKVISSNLA